MSSSVSPYPVRYSIEYRSIDAWPADSTKRSRSHQSAFCGLCRITRVYRTYAIGASAIGVPGWPEFAFWTASMERVRIVSMHSRSSESWPGALESRSESGPGREEAAMSDISVVAQAGRGRVITREQPTWHPCPRHPNLDPIDNLEVRKRHAAGPKDPPEAAMDEIVVRYERDLGDSRASCHGS